MLLMSFFISMSVTYFRIILYMYRPCRALAWTKKEEELFKVCASLLWPSCIFNQVPLFSGRTKRCVRWWERCAGTTRLVHFRGSARMVGVPEIWSPTATSKRWVWLALVHISQSNFQQRNNSPKNGHKINQMAGINLDLQNKMTKS